MLRIGLILQLAFCLMLTPLARASAQNGTPPSVAVLSPQSTKVKVQVEKLGLGAAATVRLIDGPKVSGTITAIRDGSFTLTDAKTRSGTTVNYDVVKKVKKGLPGKGSFLDRMNPWAKVVLIGGILGIVVGAAIASHDEW